jgi:polyisoprenoid-binding protein YceI
MKKNIFLILLALTATYSQAFSQTSWKAYSGTIVFKIKNRGSTVTGSLGALKSTLLFSPDKLASSSLKGTVDVATIKTGIDKRDKDLQDEKYFDAGKYKLIDVSSVKLYKKGNAYAGLFNVTIKGVTKQMEIPFQFIQQGNNAEFKGSFTLNRRDFNVGTKGGLAMMLSDDVNVSIDVKTKS